MPPLPQYIAVISGLGNGSGTGAATARLFAATLGYRVALVSRPRKDVENLKQEIIANGGVAEIFSVHQYDHASIERVFSNIKQTWPDARVKMACWNTSQWVRGALSQSNIPFMEIKEADIKLSVQINIVAATAFSQQAVACFTAPERSGEEKGGTLIFTGATSAWRGQNSFGAFAAGKHGLRAISQSIAREYGPQGVHVAFVVIDGTILTKRTAIMFGNRKEEGWLQDPRRALSGDQIAKTYLFLHQQEPGAWTLEMDLRPSMEHF